MISPVGIGSQHLRLAAHGNLAVPRTWTVRIGLRSFPVSGPTLWNSLPVELKTMHIPLETFKSKLKTYFFTIKRKQALAIEMICTVFAFNQINGPCDQL